MRAQAHNCTAAWPRWLEQRLKLQRCVTLVLAHEALSGRRYEWIDMTRWITTECRRNVLSRRFTHERPCTICGSARLQARHVMGSSTGSPLYGALRLLKWASVIDAPCEWLHRVGAGCEWHIPDAAERATRGDYTNERLLAEWALAYEELLNNVNL